MYGSLRPACTLSVAWPLAPRTEYPGVSFRCMAMALPQAVRGRFRGSLVGALVGDCMPGCILGGTVMDWHAPDRKSED